MRHLLVLASLTLSSTAVTPCLQAQLTLNRAIQVQSTQVINAAPLSPPAQPASSPKQLPAIQPPRPSPSGT